MDDVDSGAVMVGVVFVLIALFLGPAFARAGTKLSSLQETGTLPDTIADEKLSGLLRRWPREYVRWIITDTENKRYQSLGTDQERLEFIENFWARRDPFPETPENEYRAEYLERMAFVLRRFAAGKPGWATDRGRIYLLLGPPHYLQPNPMGRYSLERPSEIWTYNNLPIPSVPASLDITFVDFKGTGDFEIVSDLESTAPIVMQFGTAESNLLALAMRRNRLGMEDPRTGLGRFRDVDATRLTMREFDLQQQLIEIQRPERIVQLEEAVESRASFGRLSLQAAVGVVYTPEGIIRVPVTLAVPYQELTPERGEEELSYRLDYLIRVLDDAGEVVAKREDALTLRLPVSQATQAAAQKLTIEDTLQVRPGTYTLQGVLRDRNRERIGIVEENLEVTARPTDQLFLSSIFLADALIKVAPGSLKPFQFGSTRVVPSLDRAFDPDDKMSGVPPGLRNRAGG